MKKVFKDKKLIYIIILAVAVRILGAILFSLAGEQVVQEDSLSYIDPARDLIETGVLTGFRTPLYPLLIAAMMMLLGEQYYIGVIVFQTALNLISIIYLYRTVLLVSGKEKTARIGALIAALNFLDIYYCFQMLTDGVAQSFVMMSIFYFLSALKKIDDKNPYGQFALAALFLALAILTRPGNMYLPVCFSIGFTVVLIIKKHYRKIVPVVICIMLICQIPIAIWTEHNRVHLGYDGYSQLGQVNLYEYSIAPIVAKNYNVSFYEAHIMLMSGIVDYTSKYFEDPGKLDPYIQGALDVIKSDIPEYLKYCGIGCVCLVAYPGSLDIDVIHNGVEGLINGLKLADPSVSFGGSDIICLLIVALDVLILLGLFAMAIVGAVKLWKKDWMTCALLLGFIMYCFVVSCQPMTFGCYSRFRMSFSGESLVLSSIGLAEILTSKRKGKI